MQIAVASFPFQLNLSFRGWAIALRVKIGAVDPLVFMTFRITTVHCFATSHFYPKQLGSENLQIEKSITGNHKSTVTLAHKIWRLYLHVPIYQLKIILI